LYHAKSLRGQLVLGEIILFHVYFGRCHALKDVGLFITRQ
jgi:hypothetical protein